MNTLVLYFILANLGLAAFYLFFRLLLQKDTFFAGKRIALLVGIVLALTYPLLDLSSWIQRSDSLVTYADVLRERLPEIPATMVALENVVESENGEEQTDAVVVENAIEPANAVVSADGIVPAVVATPTNEVAPTPVPTSVTKKFNKTLSFTVFDYILLIYLLTTAFLFFRIARQLFRIQNCRKHTERTNLHGQWVYVLKGCQSPFSFFGAVFMDPDVYSDKSQLEIIEHEKAHIKQGHSYDVVFSELVCALFWINPFAWLLKRNLRENLEFLADRDVIKKGVDPKTYQYKLLQLSCHRSEANMANHFNVSQLKKRIVMMNKKRTSWKGLGKYALYLPLFAALLLTAYAWGQQHETEANALVEKATADSKVVEALKTTIDNAVALAQNVTTDKPTALTQNTPSAPRKQNMELLAESIHNAYEQTAFSIDGITYRDGVTYSNSDENAVEVVYGRSNTGKLVIPTTVKQGGIEYTVLGISNRAFADNTALRSIMIPSSVRSIGYEAFEGCTRLAEITIPSSVLSIGENAFLGCTDLKQVNIDKNNPKLSSLDGVIFNKDKTTLLSFGSCKSTQYTIPSSVTKIFSGAFRYRSGLKSITIPSSVTGIGMSAFSDCVGLTSIKMPSSVTSIGSNAFSGCSRLKTVILSSSLLTIESYAFKNCTSLTSITIPPSVTTIGSRAFSYCTNLTSVNIPASVISIGDDVFYYCESLKELDVDPKNPYYASFEGALIISNTNTPMPKIAFSKSFSFTVDGIKYISTSANTVEVISGGTYKGDLVIPATVEQRGVAYRVTSIESSAFSNCRELTSLSLPAGITKLRGSIRVSSFSSCPALTRINVDNQNPDYASIDGVLFDKNKTTLVRCAGRSEYVIPSSVTTIEAGAFAGCTGLTSLVIPSSVTSIGMQAFVGCTGLTSLALPASISSIEDGLFWGCTGLTSITIPTSVTSIGGSAFNGCIGLTSITIPPSVTSFGSRVFLNCTSLTSVTIPENVSTIAGNIFEDCSALKQCNVEKNNPYYASIDGVLFNKDGTLLISFPPNHSTQYVIPSTVKTIGYSAFYNCSRLTAVTFPSSVITIGANAFTQCTSLKEIDLPVSLASIGGGAFSGCSALNAVSIPASVLTIASGAFEGCSELKTVTIPASVVLVGSNVLLSNPFNVFGYCPKLEEYRVDKNNQLYASVDGVLFNKDKTMLIDYRTKEKTSQYVIPSTVITIGMNAFAGRQGLTSVSIPSSVTKIEGGAFSSCKGLTEVTMSSSVTSIGTGAFSSCQGLSSITIPSSVSSLGERAFQSCRGLKEIHCQVKKPLAAVDLFGPAVNKKTCVLYVPKGSSELYAQAKVWGEFATIVEE